MAKKDKKEEEAGSPPWMTTMGDMTMLLLVFFVLLFSMLTMDKVKYLKLEDQLKAMSFTGEMDRRTPSKEMDYEVLSRAYEALAKQDKAVTSVELIQGQFTKLQRLQEGTALTLGGETDPFAEGEWTLSKDHMKILDIVKKTLVGNRKYVEVRGHTSGYPTDSVVLEAGPEGPRVRKFDPKRDKPGDANWWMLAWLRANEVARYLLTDTGNGIKLKEDQVRIRADAWTRVLTIEHDPKIRSRNHRVEVVLTNEELRE